MNTPPPPPLLPPPGDPIEFSQIGAAMNAVVMSQETLETAVEPGPLEITTPGVERPAEKSNIVFYIIIAIVVLIIWRP